MLQYPLKMLALKADSVCCSTLLLVIAHPDDESMFFAPTLQHLVGLKNEVYVLCLSNGNGAGLGRIRTKELLQACIILQVPHSHVSVVDDPQLQDGMTTAWPIEAVSRQVQQFLTAHPCDTVLTFDAWGVSGHINHQGVHHGVRHLLSTQGSALGVKQAWQLTSEFILHKYSWLLSIPLSACLLKRGQVLLLSGSVRTSRKAMAAHKTQWVWYRKLFVLLSSYTYVNRLQRLDVQ